MWILLEESNELDGAEADALATLQHSLDVGLLGSAGAKAKRRLVRALASDVRMGRKGITTAMAELTALHQSLLEELTAMAATQEATDSGVPLSPPPTYEEAIAMQ